MNQFDNTPIMPSSSGTPGPMGWIQTWIKAISQPNEQAYIEISESPDSKPGTAYMWVFIGATLTSFVGAIVQAVALMISGTESGTGASMIGPICMSPVIGGLAVLFFALGTAIVQWIAKLFGGTGSYDKLVYAFAAFYMPVSLVSMLLSPFNAVPFIKYCTGFFSLILSFYALFLQVTAVKAVNRFGWGQAAGSVLIPFAVILVVCGCIVGIGFAIMGPMIADVFEQINQSLQTP